MTTSSSAARGAVLACLFAIVAAPTRADAEPATRDYVVKAGDTCMAIAVRELGDRDQLATLHGLNPQLGPLPHNLKPGQVLKLPAAGARQADAHVSAQHGDVEVRRAGEETWIQSALNADLFREWRVGSRDRASAQVTFADQSAIAMRENTVVVIYGRSRAEAKVHGFGATLERGTLRSRLAELDGRAEIATPGGTVRLGTGTAVLEVDATANTRVSNHRGAAATLTSKTRHPKAVKVDAGFGSQVAVGKEPTPPHPLPPAPVWQATSQLAIGWAGHGGNVTGTWAAVATAAKYRIELAHDPALTAVDLRLELPGTVTSFEAREVPPGDYVVAIAAVDADGFEGVPSELVPVHVVEVALPDGVAPTTGDAVPQVALGTVLAMPAGLHCAMGGEPSDHVVVDHAGTASIACTTDSGTPAAFAVEVAAARLVPPADATVIAGAAATFHVGLDATLAPLGTIVATAAEPGITIASVTRTASGVDGRGGSIDVVVHTVPDLAPDIYDVKLALTPTVATTGALVADIPLGVLAVAVVAPDADPADPAEVVDALVVERPMSPLAVSLLGGGVLSGDYGGHADRFGLGISRDIARYVAVDLDLWRPAYNSGPTTVELGVSAQPPASEARVAPIVRFGFASRIADASTIGIYAGFGFAVRLDKQLSALAIVDGIFDNDGDQLVGALGFQLRFR